jgi:hypothetical protein
LLLAINVQKISPKLRTQTRGVLRKIDLIPLLHRPKAPWTILDGDTRRATAHITDPRRDAFASTVRCEHGLLSLVFIERLLDNRTVSAGQRIAQNRKRLTATRLGFASISEIVTVSVENGDSGGKGGLTLSHEVPPRCVQRVVQTPPCDISAVGLTSVVLVYIRGTRGRLPVELGE